MGRNLVSAVAAAKPGFDQSSLDGVLAIARFRFLFESQAPLRLPRYLGSTWRGALASAFRQLTCVARRKECPGCAIRPCCPYAFLFAPSPDRPGSRFQELPRPFVIEPQAASASSASYDLLLFGAAVRYFPYLVVANQEMAQRGLGAARQSVALDRMLALAFDDEPQELWSRATGMLKPCSLKAWRSDLAPPGVDEVTLDFLTPTRIKSDESWSSRPNFRLLIATLVRRLTLLAESYGDRALPDLRPLVAKAEAVILAQAEARWVDWQRYSNRQEAKLTMGGFVGRLSYRGELAPFWPLLRLGELLHVGRGCVFGMGQYRIVEAAGNDRRDAGPGEEVNLGQGTGSRTSRCP